MGSAPRAEIKVAIDTMQQCVEEIHLWCASIGDFLQAAAQPVEGGSHLVWVENKPQENSGH